MSAGTIPAHVTRDVAHALLVRAGFGLTLDAAGFPRAKFAAPDGRETWALDEALQWALVIVAGQEHDDDEGPAPTTARAQLLRERFAALPDDDVFAVIAAAEVGADEGASGVPMARHAWDALQRLEGCEPKPDTVPALVAILERLGADGDPVVADVVALRDSARTLQSVADGAERLAGYGLESGADVGRLNTMAAAMLDLADALEARR